MSAHSWEVLGKGLGNAKNLRRFACNACNLAQEQRSKDGKIVSSNLHLLLMGMAGTSKKKQQEKPK